jgi:hypothetical protein
VSLPNLFIPAQPSCCGEVLYDAGMAKPDQTQFQKERDVAEFDDYRPA